MKSTEFSLDKVRMLRERRIGLTQMRFRSHPRQIRIVIRSKLAAVIGRITLRILWFLANGNGPWAYEYCSV
jgi:hypothetical protein